MSSTDMLLQHRRIKDWKSFLTPPLTRNQTIATHLLREFYPTLLHTAYMYIEAEIMMSPLPRNFSQVIKCFTFYNFLYFISILLHLLFYITYILTYFLYDLYAYFLYFISILFYILFYITYILTYFLYFLYTYLYTFIYIYIFFF